VERQTAIAYMIKALRVLYLKEVIQFFTNRSVSLVVFYCSKHVNITLATEVNLVVFCC
jgi:hypothetical protein